MCGGQNDEFAQLMELSGSRSGFKGLDVRIMLRWGRVLNNARYAWKYKLDICVVNISMSRITTRACFARREQGESGIKRRKLFNLRSESMSVEKLRFKKPTKRD